MDINISISNMLLSLDRTLLPSSCYHLILYYTSFGSLQNPMNNGNLDKASLKIIVIDNESLQNRVPIVSAEYSVCIEISPQIIRVVSKPKRWQLLLARIHHSLDFANSPVRVNIFL
jgi:hypothetical protein